MSDRRDRRHKPATPDDGAQFPEQADGSAQDPPPAPPPQGTAAATHAILTSINTDIYRDPNRTLPA